jgi:hypothetical protein
MEWVDMSTPFTAMMSNDVSKKEDVNNYIVITIKMDDEKSKKSVLFFNIRTTIKFSKVFARYYKRMGITDRHLCFEFGNVRIKGDQTPAMLGMKDRDQIQTWSKVRPKAPLRASNPPLPPIHSSAAGATQSAKYSSRMQDIFTHHRETTADMSIRAGAGEAVRELKCSRILLCAGSAALQEELFPLEGKIHPHPILVWEECTPESVEWLLKVMYTNDTAGVTAGNVIEITRVVTTKGFDKLLDQLIAHAVQSVTSAPMLFEYEAVLRAGLEDAGVAHLAMRQALEDMYERIVKEYGYKNTLAVISDEVHFPGMSWEFVERLTAWPALACDEEELFLYVVQWASQQITRANATRAQNQALQSNDPTNWRKLLGMCVRVCECMSA